VATAPVAYSDWSRVKRAAPAGAETGKAFEQAASTASGSYWRANPISR
jgi:hypothetical protein